MIERLGQVIYWGFCGLAAVCAVLVFVVQPSKDGWLFAAAAVLSWLFGRAVLYVLAGK